MANLLRQSVMISNAVFSLKASCCSACVFFAVQFAGIFGKFPFFRNPTVAPIPTHQASSRLIQSHSPMSSLQWILLAFLK